MKPQYEQGQHVKRSIDICATQLAGTLSEEKSRHKILSVKKLSVKKFVTGKIIRHFSEAKFLIGCLKTLTELKNY